MEQFLSEESVMKHRLWLPIASIAALATATVGKLLLTVFFAALFLAGSAAGQQKFEPTVDGRRQAITRGQAKEFLAAMEVLGLEVEKNQRWSEASSAYSQASFVARSVGQLQKAISHGTKAVELAQKANDPRLQSLAMSFLALAYADVGQPDKEREWLKKGLEATKQFQGNKEILEARLYRQLGQNYLSQRETKEAIEYLSYSVQALDARLTFLKYQARRRTPQGIQETEAQIFNGLSQLGTAYLQTGNPQEAIKAFERGMAIFKASGLKNPGDTGVVLGLGQAYLAQKDSPRAMENLTKALQMAEGRRQTSLIQHASSSIGDVYLQTDRPSEALPHYKKAIDTIESTRSLLQSEELRTSFFEDKGQIYGGVILAHLGAKNTEEAFNYNERARSRAFLDILGSKVQLARSETLVEEERTLQGRIADIKVRLGGGSGDAEEGESAERERLMKELAEADKAYTDFLAKVRKENKEQASLMNVEPLSLKQVQEMLDPGVTVLEYFVPRGKAMLWVVEKDRVNFVRLSVDRNELISKVSALRETIHQVGEKDKFKQASEELYRVLIEPVLPHIRGKELLIIPHDVLHYLPYQALLSPKGKYLIEDYPIHYLSSASLMQFTKEKKRAGGERVLVMGNPSLGDQAYNLRFAEREAREVARVYPKSEVYLKEHASKPTAISLSPNFEMLHFAVHAELNEADPMSSALLLAGEGKDDGRLKVGEIFSLNLKAGMVVLSACETGLGKNNSGDEIIGLTRAFIYAGTPSVITTLWKVNDRASYELMREFYSGLKGAKKSQALRQAQLKIMKDFPEPFFWAAYGLTGEP
jgi:CHAT domain-containing protein/Tfp pilus assembly protein PilF